MDLFAPRGYVVSNFGQDGFAMLKAAAIIPETKEELSIGNLSEDESGMMGIVAMD